STITISASTNAAGQVSQTFTANATPGGYSVSASATGVGIPTSFALTNTQAFGALHHFAVIPAVGTTAAGSGFAVQVVAQDVSNNTVGSFNGSVTFSSTDPQAAVPAGPLTLSGGTGNTTAILKTATVT